jgi:hypothetical protein
MMIPPRGTGGGIDANVRESPYVNRPQKNHHKNPVVKRRTRHLEVDRMSVPRFFLSHCFQDIQKTDE